MHGIEIAQVALGVCSAVLIPVVGYFTRAVLAMQVRVAEIEVQCRRNSNDLETRRKAEIEMFHTLGEIRTDVAFLRGQQGKDKE